MLRSLIFVLAATSAALCGAPQIARAVTPQAGDLVGLRSGGELVVIDPAGSVTSVPTLFYDASSALATEDGRLYGADTGEGFDAPLYVSPGIYRIDPDTGARTLVHDTTFLFLPTSLAATTDATVYAGLHGSGSLLDGSVRRIDPSDVVTVIEPNWFLPIGTGQIQNRWAPLEVATNGAGDLFVLAQLEFHDQFGSPTFAQGIIRRAAATQTFSLVKFGTPELSPLSSVLGQSLAVGPNGQIYLSVSQGTQPGIYRIEPATGSQTLWLAGVTGALASDGLSLLLGTATGIVTLDPVSGSQTPLFTGPAYQDFLTLHLMPEPSRAALLVPGAAALAALRPRTRADSRAKYRQDRASPTGIGFPSSTRTAPRAVFRSRRLWRSG